MIQTLNSTQYNPQKPVFHSYTRFSQIYTCTHSHSCIHLHSPLHSLCLLSSLFYLLSSVFHTHVYRRKESINIVAEKERMVDGGEGSWWWLRVVEKNVDNCKCWQFATNLHLGKIFPCNPRDQSMLPLMRHMALHPKGAQHREMLTKSKQCWNLIPETHFVSMSAGLSAVPIFCSRISPSSTISRTKWNRTSMCLVREWWTWFFARQIALW
jgi:hypothetical protein